MNTITINKEYVQKNFRLFKVISDENLNQKVNEEGRNISDLINHMNETLQELPSHATGRKDRDIRRRMDERNHTFHPRKSSVTSSSSAYRVDLTGWSESARTDRSFERRMGKSGNASETIISILCFMFQNR